MEIPNMQLRTINGVELEVHDSGGSGEPVVFVHGAWAMSASPLSRNLHSPNRTASFIITEEVMGEAPPRGFRSQFSSRLAIAVL